MHFPREFCLTLCLSFNSVKYHFFHWNIADNVCIKSKLIFPWKNKLSFLQNSGCSLSLPQESFDLQSLEMDSALELKRELAWFDSNVQISETSHGHNLKYTVYLTPILLCQSTSQRARWAGTCAGPGVSQTGCKAPLWQLRSQGSLPMPDPGWQKVRWCQPRLVRGGWVGREGQSQSGIFVGWGRWEGGWASGQTKPRKGSETGLGDLPTYVVYVIDHILTPS